MNVSRTSSIAAAFTKAVEFDIKIAEDRLQYSSWLLVVAAAGLGIAVTQAKSLLDASLLFPLLSESAGKLALLAAASCFVASAAAGALVKVFTLIVAIKPASVVSSGESAAWNSAGIDSTTRSSKQGVEHFLIRTPNDFRAPRTCFYPRVCARSPNSRVLAASRDPRAPLDLDARSDTEA